MQILTIIPARGGSKGVPGKNIKPLGDKPLIAHSIEAANKAGLEHVYVNSEDEEILGIAEKYGAKTYKRPKHLAQDQSKSIDMVQEMVKNGFESFDAVLLLQPTCPFRELGVIERAIKKFKEEKLDSLISVLEVPDHYNPHWVFEANSAGQLQIATGEKEIISRRQDLPTAYFRDGAIYLTAVNVILNQTSFYGESLGYIKNNPKYYVNIDRPEDWEEASRMWKSFKKEGLSFI